MTDEQKMIRMCEIVHGQLYGQCYFQYDLLSDGYSILHVMKDGNVCWSVTKTELLFDYVTKDWSN